MVNDDLVKCPFCGGFTHVSTPALVAALKDPKVRKQVEDYALELLRSPSNEPVAVAQGQATPLNFRGGSNPNVPMWSRSPKE
ncbi:MAG: hypothetical protein WBM24_21900 [Candidatus Sulfotelmatobacter sp.]